MSRVKKRLEMVMTMKARVTYDCEVPEPIGAHANSRPSSPSVKWKNFWHVNPRNAVHTRAKDEHVGEEESNRCRRKRFASIGAIGLGQESRNHKHGDG